VDEGKVACVVSTSVTFPSPSYEHVPPASSHSVLVGLAVTLWAGSGWVGLAERGLSSGLRARPPCVHQKDNSIVIHAPKPRSRSLVAGKGE
jgi:hypothetical protein